MIFVRWLNDMPEGATKTQYKTNVLLFRSWCGYGGGRMLDFIPDMRKLMAYRKFLEDCGYAYDTVRHRLFVINSAFRYEHQMTDGHVPLLHLSPRSSRLPFGATNGEKVMEIEGLRELLKAASGTSVFAPILFQACCGVRCLEATNIRAKDVDMFSGTISVTDTDDHTPKTKWSYRTIPVYNRLFSLLPAVKRTDSDRPLSVPKGGALLSWRVDSYSRAVKSILKRIGEPYFQPRWLRATFGTYAVRYGADRSALKVYMGHCPGDVLGTNYEHVSVSDMRVKVISHIADFIEDILPGKGLIPMKRT